ncbi:MAG: RUS1 family protein, partial [Candidatus Eremiobacterota bacterium]
MSTGVPGAAGQAERLMNSGQAVASEQDGERVVLVQPGQRGYDAVTLSEGESGGRGGFLMKSFLPVGYPDNVHPDYMPFRKWQFIRDVSAGITSFYATEAVVGAMGFGDVGFLSAGMTWMIRDAVDGVGKFGAAMIAPKADQDPHGYTVRGEFFSGAGTLMECALLAVPQTFPVMAPMANIMKALGNGTKTAAAASIEKHQALANNLGDLRSKNSNQSMLASALGAGLAYGLKVVGQMYLGPVAVPLLAALTTGVALYAQKRS